MNKEITISPRQIAQAVDNLLDEKEQLQQRIDKAIEYIENNTYDDSLDGDGSRLMFEKANGKELLEILKGEDND